MTAVKELPLIDAARTAAELRAKLSGLTSELTSWREATVREDGPLRRHHTQVRTVAGTLEQASADLAKELGGEDQGLWVLEEARRMNRRIVDLHRLWGFFRSKLALRYVPWLERPLIAADDLAWACYEPAQAFVPPKQRREPPLLYFTGGTSPFLMPRGAPYVVEPLPDGGMREPEFAEAVRSIPVALIGLPWFQVEHLPDAPLIAHEVGHAVEQDLQLAEPVRDLIQAKVPADRRAAWGAWSGEVFADIYGTLGCGSGFARALAALLADHPREVAGEVRGEEDWGSYPPRTVRVLLAAAVLAKLGVGPADESVADRWLHTYKERPLRAYEEDVSEVVKAVIDGPYPVLGGKGLTSVLPYTADDEEAASRIADHLLAGLRPDEGGVRQLLGGARLAYDRSRREYATSQATKISLAWIADIPMDGVRAAGGADTPPEPLRTQRDEAAGHALAKLISRAAGRDDEQEVADVSARHP
jgi:hypothetical protein